MFAAAVVIILWPFSLPSVGGGGGAVFMNDETRLFLDGMGVDVVGGGMKLVIFLRGSLSLEGPNGGFFSETVLGAANFGREAAVEVAARALLSCFSLAFLSSAS